MGIGGAGLIASGAFYLMRSKAISDLDSACVDTRCPASMQNTGDKGKLYTTLGNVSLGLGVVGLGVGTVLLLTGNSNSGSDAASKKESISKSRMTVVFGGSSHSGEAHLVGTF
jgi:hypothetical protein